MQKTNNHVDLPINFIDVNSGYVFLYEDVLGYGDYMYENKVKLFQKKLRKTFKLKLMVKDIKNGDLNNYNKYKKYINYEYKLNNFYHEDHIDKNMVKENLFYLITKNKNNKDYILRYFFDIDYTNYRDLPSLEVEDIIKWLKKVRRKIKESKFSQNVPFKYLLFKKSFVISASDFINDIKNDIIQKGLSKLGKNKLKLYNDLLKGNNPYILGLKIKGLGKDKKTNFYENIYINKYNTTEKMWSKFKELIYKWSYKNYNFYKIFGEYLEILNHPFYPFLSSCIIFDLKTIYDPMLHIKFTKERKIDFSNLIHEFKKLKRNQKVLDEIIKIIDQENSNIDDIKKIINDKKNANKIKEKEKLAESIFLYPGKLPSKNEWTNIYDREKLKGNVIPGQRGGQLNTLLRNYRSYIFLISKNVSKKETIERLFIDKDDILKINDEDEIKNYFNDIANDIGLNEYNNFNQNLKNIKNKLNLTDND